MQHISEPRDLRIIRAASNLLWTLALGIIELSIVIAIIAAIAHVVAR